MDNTQLIEAAHQYLNSRSEFPSHREDLLRIVRAAIAEIAGNSEQRQVLIALEKVVSVPAPSVASFPGSCAR